MDLRAEVERAHARIRGHVRRTPVEPSPVLSERTGARVHLKLENWQRTGSFKLRGATNKLLVLDEDQGRLGVVAASTGNHGAAVAFAARSAEVPAVVFAPEGAARSKILGIQDLGAEVRFAGEDCIDAEREARDFAEREGLVYVSPYNDLDVVAGQGTIGSELAEQLGGIDAVIASVGGGGLIGGIGAYFSEREPPVEIVGSSPRNSAVLHASLEAGEILELPSLDTLSDGTAGGVEAGSVTFPLCQRVVDHFTLVEEDEIRAALQLIVERHHMLIEGAAAVAVAALLKEAERYANRDVVVVLCGANIDAALLKRVL
jgi:threonine dehydratase